MLVSSLLLLFTVVGSVELATTARVASETAAATPLGDTLIEGVPGTAVVVPSKPLAEDEIDVALVRAVHARREEIREMVFQLSVEDTPSAPMAADGIPIPSPTIEAGPAVEVRPARPALIVGEDELRAHLEPLFGDETELAYRIVMCESAGNATVATGNGYYGLWQFDLATWVSVGGSGYPSDASVAEQVLRAKLLRDARGWQPWGCAGH